jgi:hypothetical protein
MAGRGNNNNNVSGHDFVKWVGVMLMWADHVGCAIMEIVKDRERPAWLEHLAGTVGVEIVWSPHLFRCWRIVGRMAAPIFFFMAGYHSSIEKKDCHSLRWMRTAERLGWSCAIWLGVLWSGMTTEPVLSSLAAIELERVLLFQMPWSEALVTWIDRSHQFALPVLFVLAVVSDPMVSTVLDYGTMGVLYMLAGRMAAANERGVARHLALHAAMLAHSIDSFIEFTSTVRERWLVTFLWLMQAVLLMGCWDYWGVNWIPNSWSARMRACAQNSAFHYVVSYWIFLIAYWWTHRRETEYAWCLVRDDDEAPDEIKICLPSVF